MRLQEFYESPYGVQGTFFTVEQYMDIYAKHNGTFNYTSDWDGFNVPGHVVDKFYTLFKHDLLDKEKQLIQQITKYVKQPNGTVKNRYYVIGTYSEDCIQHELCHALWYLYPQFRSTSKQLINQLSPQLIQHAKQHLIEAGYSTKVLLDEINAYLSTSSMPDIRGDILSKYNVSRFPWNRIYELQDNFVQQRDLVEIDD